MSFLSLLSTVTYGPNGIIIPNGYVQTISSNGTVIWTSTLGLDTGLTVSTLRGSTLLSSEFSTKNIGYSTLTGSTLYSNTGTVSTLIGSTLVTGSVAYSTLVGSSLYGNSGTVSSLTGSTLVTGSVAYSTLVGSSLYANSGTVSSLTGSTLVTGSVAYSTLVGSSLYANSGTVSSLTGSTLVTGSVGVSTLTGSTLTSNVVTTSKINLNSTLVALGQSTTQTQANFSEGSYAEGSWITAKSSLTNGRKVAMSSTGQYQIIVSGGTSDLWLSSDSGVTWTGLTTASCGLPTLTGSAYWSSGSISASGQQIVLSVYGGSLWMSNDYGRTFALTSQATPTIWLPLNGTFTDIMGSSTVTTPGTVPGFVTVQQPGYSTQAVNLANTAGSSASRYVRGTCSLGTSFTVSFWFNFQGLPLTNSTISRVVSLGNATQNILSVNYLNLSGGYTGLYVSFFTSDNIQASLLTAFSTNLNITTNTWYYISVSYNPNGTSLVYFNNNLVASLSSTNGLNATPSIISIGTNTANTNDAFNGYVDDLRIYNTFLPYVPIPLLAPNIWLPFENSVADLGSNAITPTVTGSLSYVPGVVGLNAVNLVNDSGAAAYRYLTGSNQFGQSFTVSGWFNLQTYASIFANQFIFCTGGTGSEIVVLYIATDNKIRLLIPNGIDILTNLTASLNTWYHFYIIIQPSGNTCYLYLNGIPYTGVPNANINNTGLFGLGTYDTGSTFGAFNGYIDDFRIYNAAIPFHVLFPQNYRSVALSGTGQYLLASAASGHVVGSSDSGVTWTKQSVSVGTQGDLIQPNKTGLTQAQWEKDGVNWVASASSIYSTGYPVYHAFNNITNASEWVSAFTYNISGAYVGSITTNIIGVGTISGEWIQLQVSVPSILQSYTYACAAHMDLPKNYYIVGSNDGATWYPVQYVAMSTNPFNNLYQVATSNILVNFSGIQTIQGAVTGSGSTTAYPSSTTPFSYFRIVVTSNYGTSSTMPTSFGELYLNFSRPSPTTLALSYSGQYQMVATGSAAGSVMPNQSGLVTPTWSQGGVMWGAQASSNLNANLQAFGAFNNALTGPTAYSWGSAATYNGSGVYTGSVSTTILGGIGNKSGEWLQIQSSVPLVLQSYTYGCGGFANLPKEYYIVGSMDGSNWYPLQYAVMTTNPLTANFQLCTSYITTNTTGSFTIAGAVTGSGTSTAYSFTTQPWMFFRFVCTVGYNPSGTLIEFGELYLNFSNSVSYSTNYGATWSNTIGTVSNEIVSLSPSGQYALSTNTVAPFVRLTLDNTTLDSQGGITYSAGSVTSYSPSIVKVGTSSAYFNNTAGGSPSAYLNYTIPSVLITTTILTMSCWVYPTSYGDTCPIIFNNGTTTFGANFNVTNATGAGRVNFNTWNTNSTQTTIQSATGVVPLNTWTHIAGTYGNGLQILYVNGVMVGSVSAAGILALNGGSAPSNFFVGAGGPTQYAFAGYIDDVRLYTSVLTAHGIESLYKNPSLSQTIGVSSSYLPITSYVKPTLPGVTANVVDAKVSQTGQYMVAVTSATTNNVYYSTDFGSTFNALSVNGYTQAGATTPLARLPLDNSDGDVLGGLTQATGAGTVTYSTSIKKVGLSSAFFNNTAGGAAANYLNYTVPAVLNMPSALTMVGWTYRTGSGNSMFTMFANGSTNGTQLYFIGLDLNFSISTTNNQTPSYISTGISIPLNTWSHIALTYRSGELIVYVNGSNIYSSTSFSGNVGVGSEGLFKSITSFIIGGNYGSNYAYAGYVDDVRIYTSALSSTEISALYAGTYDSLYTVAPMVSCAISNDGSYFTVTNSSTTYTLNRNSKAFTLAVGSQAGAVNQASNAIAIGNKAGQINQSANSIVLNATGASLGTGAAGFYVSPIATTAGLPMDLLGYGSDSQVVRTGVTVLPGGNVGVGTTNPQAILHVGSATAATGIQLKLSDDIINRKIVLYDGGARDEHQFYGIGINPNILRFQVYSTANLFAFYAGTSATSSNEIMRINGYGNVGIGTSNPNAPLHVHTTSAWSLIRASTANSSSTAAILLDPTGTVTPSNPSWFIGERFGSHGPLSIWAFDGTNHLGNAVTVAAGGKVGIGITNPNDILHIRQSAGANLRLSTTDSITSSSEITFDNAISGYWHQNGYGNNPTISTRGAAYAAGMIRCNNESGNNYEDSYMTFWTCRDPHSDGVGGLGVLYERMRITSWGGVGIGTTNPDVSLHVNGSTRIRGKTYSLVSTVTGVNTNTNTTVNIFPGDVTSNGTYLLSATGVAGGTATIGGVALVNWYFDGGSYYTATMTSISGIGISWISISNLAIVTFQQTSGFNNVTVTFNAMKIG